MGFVMASRVPAASPFANSDSPLAIVVGRGSSPRIFHVRPWLAAIGGILSVLLLGWYLVATAYLVFRDEMLARLINQQTEMQYAYEDRLAALRNQIDRITSRQLVDQNSLDGKLHELISRQSQLETRHAIIAALADQPGLSGTGAPRPAPRPGQRTADPVATGAIPSFAPSAPKPLPERDPFELRSLSPGGPRASTDTPATGSSAWVKEAPATVAVVALRETTDRIERQQLAVLEGLERTVRSNARRWSDLFAETGLDAGRYASSPKQGGAQGGPLVPLASNRPASPFELRLTQVQTALVQAERMRRIVNTLPVNRPLSSEHDITSGYGARHDPFTRGLAMHTGIDFRAPSGTPARATAPGKVVEADWVGGYGNMVEVDHGNGLTTRYAHLSSVEVDVGQTITKGQVIGRVGSTGRSTGPHLHYETRLDGDPMDPMRFVRAGQKFGAN
jgi:murein DD-endopeptidase MepM/ murein hydrolase activator NlpD